MSNPREQYDQRVVNYRSPKAKTAKQVAKEVVDRLEERMRDPRSVWGIPWPFPGLNLVTGGIHETEMTILAARPSVGKTQILVQTANSVAQYLSSDAGREHDPQGVIKLVLCESTAEVFFRRWACLRARVPQQRVMSGMLSPAAAERFKTEMRRLYALPIEVLDTAQSIDEITRFLTTGSTVWWGLDYVQKCPLQPNRPNDGSVGPITIISRELTEVARLKAPGLVLAHTPREVDKREDRRPRMGDLKGGSSLEGDARVVMGLYREAVYQRRDEIEQNAPQMCELLVLKQNEGEAPATVDLLFHPRRGMFDDVSEKLHSFTDDEDDDDVQDAIWRAEQETRSPDA